MISSKAVVKLLRRLVCGQTRAFYPRYPLYAIRPGLPRKVRIVEVGARDGIQADPTFVPTEDKIRMINVLSGCGFPVVEATAFVGKAVPQMMDAELVMKNIDRKEGVVYSCLAPNRKAVERAASAGVTEVAVFPSCTDAFAKKNLQLDSAQISLERAVEVIDFALGLGMQVRGCVSVAFGCAYTGVVDPAVVVHTARTMKDAGCFEICLDDTAGMSSPGWTQHVIRQVKNVVAVEDLAVHMHDTMGNALANVLVSLQEGISVIDSSVAGLGGCPFVEGAAGNLATEDLLFMLQGMGISTGVNISAVVEAGELLCGLLGRPVRSAASRAISARGGIGFEE